MGFAAGKGEIAGYEERVPRAELLMKPGQIGVEGLVGLFVAEPGPVAKLEIAEMEPRKLFGIPAWRFVYHV